MDAAAPIRVGIDIGKVLGVPDGVATYTRLLVKALMDSDRDNHYALCDLFRPEIDRELIRERLGELPPNFSLHGKVEAAREGFDVFHSPAFRLPPRSCCRLVFTLHDVTFITHSRCHTLDNRLASVTSTAAAAALGARFVAVSEHTRSEAMRVLRLPAEAVEVIYQGFDPIFNIDAPVDGLERLGVSGPYLLNVGSIEPRKNLATLVEAFAALPEGLRDRLQLVVVGAGGWLNEDIHESIERARERCTITLLGKVTLDELAALYRGAEIFVYPSLSEGFGLPVVEAMACGTPVIASNLSSLPEVAGDAALLVDPADPEAIGQAIVQLNDDRQRGNVLRSRGPQRAARFSWKRAADRYRELYLELARC